MITTMKLITTLFFVLLIGISTQAQDVKNTSKKEVSVEASFNEVEAKKENNIARIYKYKNHRITRALSFTTKKSKSKLA